MLDIAESAISEVSFYDLIKRQVRLDDTLRVGSRSYDLDNIGDIFVVGGGKYVSYVAAALEDILQDRISAGIVVEKEGCGSETKRIVVTHGGHPLPDASGADGANEVVKLVRRADEDDLVIVCVTGGCTSLLTLPPNGITIEEVREVFDLLLRSGAPIEDVNTVRKHLSRLGGGKLTMLVRSAEILSLIAMDEVAGLPWGPSVADSTTFVDAIGVLKTYGLWENVPDSVRNYFEKADPAEETPKSGDFARAGARNSNVIFAHNGFLCEAALRRATELRFRTVIVSTGIEGEAKHVATVLASMAKEIEKNSRPLAPPCVLIAGGETTVTITDERGRGGRNQEFALAAALKITRSENIVVASIGTDGTDGPTDIAGAIVDGYTLDQAESAGIDGFQQLKRHNSSYVLANVNDAIYTYDTKTNLMDLIILFVDSPEAADRSPKIMAEREQQHAGGPQQK